MVFKHLKSVCFCLHLFVVLLNGDLSVCLQALCDTNLETVSSVDFLSTQMFGWDSFLGHFTFDVAFICLLVLTFCISPKVLYGCKTSHRKSEVDT